MPRLLLGCVLVLTSGVLSGCFVLDELDAGMEIMEQHTPADKKKPAAQASTADQDEEGPPDPSVWWSNARSLNRGPQDQADAQDPNAPTSCELRGSTRFMRRGDCLAQGGTPRA